MFLIFSSSQNSCSQLCFRFVRVQYMFMYCRLSADCRLKKIPVCIQTIGRGVMQLYGRNRLCEGEIVEGVWPLPAWLIYQRMYSLFLSWNRFHLPTLCTLLPSDAACNPVCSCPTLPPPFCCSSITRQAGCNPE